MPWSPAGQRNDIRWFVSAQDRARKRTEKMLEHKVTVCLCCWLSIFRVDYAPVSAPVVNGTVIVDSQPGGNLLPGEASVTTKKCGVPDSLAVIAFGGE